MILTHTHSDYSTLDGCMTCTQRADRAQALGHWALALTDHGVLNGIPSHIKACEKVGIQPILGMEAYYRPDRHVRGKEWQYARWHMILIAQNLKGWHNLVRLSSESFKSGFYQNACVDDELLDRWSEGIIFTTSCVAGPLCHSIQQDNGADTEAWLDRFAARAPDRVYVEIQPGDFDKQRMLNPELINWAHRKGLPIIAGTDSHYDVPGKATAQKIMALIGINSSVAKQAEANKKRLENGDEIYELGHEGLHMMDEAEVRARFAEYHPTIPEHVVDEAINNTDALALSVLPFSFNRQLKMPHVVDSQEQAEELVRAWCRESLERLGLAGNKVYEDQLEYEFGVIRNRKNFDYIYIIGLVVRWARSDEPLPVCPEDPFPMRKRPIRVGSGRGSAAGSLVCYLSRITALDPITHKLKFERFLNADRKGLPDIDIDFPSNRRNEVKEYVARLLGRDKIADIAAFGRFTCRAAIKDTARMMGVDSWETQKVTDLIDPVHDEDLGKLREVIPVLRNYAHKYPQVWEVAETLENHGDPLIKNISKHAAGVLMMDTAIEDHIPTIRADEDDPTPRTAWSETPRFSIVEEFGLVKADFLSLKGLEQQDLILERYFQRTGELVDLDELEFCRDPSAVEPAIMDKFRRGLTLGINQFEGGGVTSFMKQAQPQSFVDIAAINALYRPGPMGSGGHNHFARRLTGQEEYEIHPLLEEVLGDTYGVLAFQEQVMGLFEVLAGSTPSEADNVRKIISKLYREKGDVARDALDELEEQFMTAAIIKVGEDLAHKHWIEIPPYAGYSFNRAHASGYSAQAVQDMWQKEHMTAEFYAVQMTLQPKKAPAAVKESMSFGMTVTGPDINLSAADFTITYETKTIRFGLEAIHGVGETAAAQVIELAPYTSLEDFGERNSIKYSKCNAGHRRALLEAGALDSLGGRAEWTETEKAQTESDRLQIALRPGGTFGDDEAFIESCAHSQDELEELQPNSAAVVAGVITEVKVMTTKRGRNPGQQMGKISLRFGLDVFEATLFPRAWAEHVASGHYFAGEHGYQQYNGWPCFAAHTDDSGRVLQVRFSDDVRVNMNETDTFEALIQKKNKVIITGKVDERGQVIANGVMDIQSFLADQRA